MIILGIETSCDETGICILDIQKENEIEVLSNELYSQIAIHAQFGGVYPNMARRAHGENLVPILKKALTSSKLLIENKTEINPEKLALAKQALAREPELFTKLIELVETIEKPKIDAIAVTNGPGLEVALWVGVTFAKALSILWDITLVPTNHMEGHIFAALLQKTGPIKNDIPHSLFNIQPLKFPAISLLISGGHTELVLIKDNKNYEVIGRTRDDAVGEAFDKVARLLGLPYPGGPQISKLAEKERLESPTPSSNFKLPRPMVRSGDLDFSFSGLKTAVLYTTREIKNLDDKSKQELAREFEDAAVEVLISKSKQAIEKYSAKTLILGGGVSANKKIRNDSKQLADDMQIDFLIPEVSASTDNALMIAIAGYYNLITGAQTGLDFKAEGNLTF